MSQQTYAPPVAPAPRGPALASLGRRVAAYAIDAAISGIAVTVLVVLGVVIVVPLADGSPETLLLMLLFVYGVIGLAGLAWAFVYTAMQGGNGSPGQRIMRVQVRDAATGTPIGFGRALLRNIIWGLAGSIIVGYFTPLFDHARRQGWHDKVVGAVVIDAVPGIASTAASAAPRAAGASGASARGVAPAAPGAPRAGSAPGAFPAGARAMGAPAAAAPGSPAASASAAGRGFATPPPPAYPSAAPRPVAPAFQARGDGDGMISQVPGITIDPAGATAAAASAAPGPGRVARATGASPAVPPAPVVVPAVSKPAVSTPVVSTPVVSTPAVSSPAVATPAVSTPAVATSPVSTRTASTPTAPVAASAPSGEIDIDETRAAPPTRAVAVLVWDDGTRTGVFTRTLFGRNPGREEGAVVASIRDETLSLSKTHFEIGSSGAGPYVIDRHSTNGTTLVRDGGRQVLTPGVQTSLRPGDVLEFGDRRATVGGDT